MNETALRQPRRVLPRWRLFKATTILRELEQRGPGRKPPVVDDGADIIEHWKDDEKTVGLASELLIVGLQRKDAELSAEAARFIESRRDTKATLTPLQSLALATLRSGGKPLEDQWMRKALDPKERTIANLRKAVRLHPRNPVAWTELALLHAIHGNKDSARRCMQVAVTLAPEDRYVLRSAVRCFAHLREHETGMKVISKASRTKEDPWLLSAHLALSQALQKPQRLMKNAKAMSESGAFSPFDLSELNAALGSVLKQEESHKRANKHFRASLVDPTENALCQVVYDRQTSDWREIVNAAPDPLQNFESDARTYYQKLNLEESCKSASKWLEDEPFSARPALFGSFVAGVGLEDYEQGLKFIEEGLKPNPKSSTLLNNQAVLLARKGEWQLAEESLRLARHAHDGDASTTTVLHATDGLIHFRKGEVERGRQLYLEAIEEAELHNRDSQAAMAKVFLAREEFDAGLPSAEVALADARASVMRLPASEIDSRIAFIKVHEIVEAAKKAQEESTAAPFELQFKVPAI